MLKDKVICAFFALLRAGLWDKHIDRLDCFPLSDREWDALFQLSIHQTVEGIVFDGIQQMDPNSFPPRDLLLRWLVRVEKIEQRNNWMNRIIAEQCAFFKHKGVQPLLLKGQGLALCYPNPLHRICGDIDWYFPAKDAYRKAFRCIADRGVKIQATAGYSAYYQWRGCGVDHHQKLFDIHNPFCRGYLRNLEQEEKKYSLHIALSGAELLSPAPLIQILQTSTHILKHLLSFGIGIRQLCDVARVYTTYQKQIDGPYLEEIYTRLNIIKWVDLLHDVLIRFIGLSTRDLPFSIRKEQDGDWMMEEILRSGNFGFHDERYSKEKQLQGREKSTQRIWNNLMKYFPYAPMEALSFPWVHFYSGLIK